MPRCGSASWIVKERLLLRMRRLGRVEDESVSTEITGRSSESSASSPGGADEREGSASETPRARDYRPGERTSEG
jgi:hypothetical protein